MLSLCIDPIVNFEIGLETLIDAFGVEYIMNLYM